MTDSTAISTKAYHKYGIRCAINLPYAEAVARTRAALQQEGFGVLFELEMQAKLMSVVGNPTLEANAQQINKMLRRVVEKV